MFLPSFQFKIREEDSLASVFLIETSKKTAADIWRLLFGF